MTVRGRYQPLVEDFDGDGRSDGLWYGPGAAPDVLWRGRPGGRFAARPLVVRGEYQPLHNYVLALYHAQAQNRLDAAAVVDSCAATGPRR